MRSPVAPPEIVSDINCGAEYHRLKEGGIIGEDDITILWNCDGIPAFESNTYQIWPIQCQLVELHPKERQEKNLCPVPVVWQNETQHDYLFDSLCG